MGRHTYPYLFGFPEALALASGGVLDADVVLTADTRWTKLSPRVVVV